MADLSDKMLEKDNFLSKFRPITPDVTLKDIPTHVIVRKQVEDVLKAHETVVERLNNSVAHQKSVLQENFVTRENEQKAIQELQDSIRKKYIPYEKFEAVSSDLQTEKFEHGRTKHELHQVTDKLEFALGEIEILTKQLEREKDAFQASYNTLKNKTVQLASKGKDTENKLAETKKKCSHQETIIKQKDEEVTNLQKRLEEMESRFKHRVGEMDVEKKQEEYIANMMDGRKSKKAVDRRAVVRKR